MNGKNFSDPPTAAFFDLDKTVIAKSSTLAYGGPFRRAGYLRRRTLVRAAAAQAVYLLLGADQRRLDRVRDRLLALTKGWDAQAVRRLVRETVDDVIAPLVYAEALALIDEHRRRGRRVVLVSASPEEVVEPLADYLGVDHVIATRSRVDSAGRYTGELAFYADGPGKAEAVRDLAGRWGLELRECFAYSDSSSDLPLLETVGRPAAVNPDKELRRRAEEEGWPVEEFSRPVNLRARLASLPKPTPALSGAAAAAGAAAVGGAALWWALVRRRLS